MDGSLLKQMQITDRFALVLFVIKIYFMKRVFVFAVMLILGGKSFANSTVHFPEGRMVKERNATLPVYFTDKKAFRLSILDWYAFENPGTPGVLMPDAKGVHARALSDFQIRFNDVTQVQWFSDATGFTSYFMKDGYNDRAFYGKNGRWKFSLLYETEHQLPKDIRAAVKSVYYDWNINVVVEVQSTEGKGYVIYLEDNSKIRMVKVNADRELEIMMDLDKQ